MNMHNINLGTKPPSRWFMIKRYIRENIIPYKLTHWYDMHILPIYKPQHTRIRKAIPRTWADISYLAVVVNFEMIKSFYENEYKNGIVDWGWDEEHKQFADWVESAYKYITVERPELEKQMEAAYPEFTGLDNWLEEINSCKQSYQELYGEVNRIEKLINDNDTEVIQAFIKNRHFFWT